MLVEVVVGAVVIVFVWIIGRAVIFVCSVVVMEGVVEGGVEVVVGI